MNKQLLRKFEAESILIHPENNDRSVFYAIVLAFILKNKYKNAKIDFILAKKYRFLRALLPFKIGKIKSEKYYDFYISLQKDYKTIWKYRILEARVRFGVLIPLTNKLFDVFLKNEDNPKLIIEDFCKTLNIDFNANIWFKKMELRPYIKRKETIFLSPYDVETTNLLISKIKNRNYHLIYSDNFTLEELLTVVIHNYEKIIVLNSTFDHFISFMRDKVEILFASINYKEHIYSRQTQINPIKYTCSPCNVDSIFCPLKDENKRYLCIKNGIYSI
jgi:hypothetical protein